MGHLLSFSRTVIPLNILCCRFTLLRSYSLHQSMACFRGIVGDAGGSFSSTCHGRQLDRDFHILVGMIEQGRLDLGPHFSYLIESCITNKSLNHGRRVNTLIISLGLELGDFLGSHLVRMFAFCESLVEADQVFSRISMPGNLLLCSFICALTKLGKAKQATLLFFRSCQSSMKQDGHILAAVLQACSIVAAMTEVLYAQCGNLEDAHHLFDKHSRLEVVTWSVLIGEYTKLGKGQEALRLYLQMQQQDVRPDKVVFAVVLNACASALDIDYGRLVHGQYVESALKSDAYIGNTMVDMYAKCGSLEDAWHIFGARQDKDVVAWSGIISSFVQHAHFAEALELFRQMQGEAVDANNFTFACALKACTNLGDLYHGKLVHTLIIYTGYEADLFAKSTLVNMYSKCQSLEDAHSLFEKIGRQGLVDWSMMISGYAMCKGSEQALKLNQLLQEEGLHVDTIVFTDMLKACMHPSKLREARLIHTQIAESCFECDRFIGASLIDSYAKCRTLEDARTIFDQMLDKDVVIWGVMMAAYVEAGMGEEVMHVFQGQLDKIELNNVVMVCALKACCGLVAPDQGKLIHGCAIETGWELDIFVDSALINMYSKCGHLEDAFRMFEMLPRRNAVVWTAMIGGCAHHNEYNLALRYFEDMQSEGFKPDEQTYMCLLTACNHVGLAEDCHRHLCAMEEEQGLSPTVDHYNCVADVLGRVGRVKNAIELLETKTCTGNIVGWMSLLNHCKTYGDVKEGKQCLQHIVAFDRKHAAGYTLMSKAYVSAGMTENAEALRTLRESANAWKKPGLAYIELKNKVHNFSIGERLHPQMHEIHLKLRRLHGRMQAGGYIF